MWTGTAPLAPGTGASQLCCSPPALSKLDAPKSASCWTRRRGGHLVPWLQREPEVSPVAATDGPVARDQHGALRLCLRAGCDKSEQTSCRPRRLGELWLQRAKVPGGRWPRPRRAPGGNQAGGGSGSWFPCRLCRWFDSRPRREVGGQRSSAPLRKEARGLREAQRPVPCHTAVGRAGRLSASPRATWPRHSEGSSALVVSVPLPIAGSLLHFCSHGICPQSRRLCGLERTGLAEGGNSGTVSAAGPLAILSLSLL